MKIEHPQHDLYFECHVTIEPVFDEKLIQAENISKMYGFRVASLQPQNGLPILPERSMFDTFMTAHSKSLSDLQERMGNLILHLKSEGFKVWRYKIEDTVLDSRSNDIYGLIDKKETL